MEDIEVRNVAAGRLTATAGSVIGHKYRENYDAMHVGETFAVADGMGDGPGSSFAGRTAVATFAALARPEPAALRAAVAEAQRLVVAEGQRLGMLTGCTLTALVPDGDTAWLVQIGDSRAYRLRDNRLELLTSDHTQAWLGAVNGWYPFDSPQAHHARYQLTRFVGMHSMPEPDVLNVTLRPGDVYLLCTDGLAEQVPFQRIEQLLRTPDPVPRLLADSLTAGGHDNATAIVLR